MTTGRCISRRDVFTVLAGTFVGAQWPRDLCAQVVAPKGLDRIDVHHHFQAPGSVGLRDWSAAIALDAMDRDGVAVGVGNVQGDPVLRATIDPERRRAQVRGWNDFGAKVVASRPDRFGLFATLPLDDIDGTLQEIDYAYTQLKADGCGIATSYADKWVGDPTFEPVFQELNRRSAIVFVHPTDAPCCVPAALTYEKPPIQGAWLEWPMNTARAIFSLIANGSLRRYPRIRFIFSHGGGVMPLLVSRIEGEVELSTVGPDRFRAMFPNGIRSEFATLYFEGAQAFDPVNFDALTKLVPMSHILFGTDYNRLSIATAVSALDGLKLPSESTYAIGRGNAETLFPRFKAALRR